MTLSVGIAGLGYWGPNLLRNFRAIDACRVAAVADVNPARLAEATRLYPDLRTHASAEALIDDPDLDAVALALPAGLLPQLAERALDAGKHVIVEKPMADSLEAGARIAAAAERADRVAMVDFTFVYSPPVQRLRSILASDELGAPQYYQSTRINLGRFQPDVDVVWDLVVHDVAILGFVLGRHPAAALATGHGRSRRSVDTAHVTLFYEDGFQAFVHVSWLAPTKVRTALLACADGMVVYDDVHPDEKIRIHRIEQEFDPSLEDPLVPTYRLGDVLVPSLPREEPLRVMASAFVDAVSAGVAPPTDAVFGLEVLAVLEAARRSLTTGRAVPVTAIPGARAGTTG